jgi:colicin import membrane protein
MTTEITEYSKTESALADLNARYGAVIFETSTTKGMQEAIAGRAEIRGYLVNLEKERVRIKAPALERCRLIDTEAKRITAALEALKNPIDVSIKAEQQKKENERLEKERIERERIEAINARFAEIKALPLGAMNVSASEIQKIIDHAEAIDELSFPEDMQPAAKYEKRLAITALRAALDARNAHDAEQVQIKADRERLARLEAEQEAIAAERGRLAAVERELKDEAERAERQRIDAERAKAQRIEDEKRAEQRLAFEAEQAEAKKREKAAADKLAADRAKLEAEKKAAAKATRDAEIANASLTGAATEALQLLKSEGYGEHLVTQKLESALTRNNEKVAA